MVLTKCTLHLVSSTKKFTIFLAKGVISVIMNRWNPENFLNPHYVNAKQSQSTMNGIQINFNKFYAMFIKHFQSPSCPLEARSYITVYIPMCKYVIRT